MITGIIDTQTRAPTAQEFSVRVELSTFNKARHVGREKEEDNIVAVGVPRGLV